MKTKRNRAVMRNDSTGQFKGSVGGRRLRGAVWLTQQLVVDHSTPEENRRRIVEFFAEERKKRGG